MNIAEQLLKGSRKIDAMERDINDLTSMMLGLVRKHASLVNYRGVELHFTCQTAEWILYVADRTSLACKIGCGTAYSSVYGPDYLHGHTDDIQDVYGSLSVLVEGLRTTFPELEQYLKPFLRAGAM